MDKPASQIDRETAVKALEAFISENDLLYELEERVGKFNVFDALRVDRREIRHSNFLAWLLDPSESHGQQDLFLSALLMDLLRNAPVSDRPFSPIDLDGETLSNVDVRREWKNIDLLIKIDDPKCLVLIENKIGSGEHSGQLKRYKEIARQHFPDYTDKTLCVFLTVEGDEPSDEDWMVYTYADLHRVFTRCRRLGEGAIGEDVTVFLDHYLTLIGSRFMDDPTIEDLCRKIYKNHRVAIDLIISHIPDESSVFIDAANVLLEAQETSWTVLRRSSKSLYFIPKPLEDALPSIGKHSKFAPSQWIRMELKVEGDSVVIDRYAQDVYDIPLRTKILETIVEESSTAEESLTTIRSKNIDNTYVSLGRITVSRWNGSDPPALEEFQTDIERALNTIKNESDNWCTSIQHLNIDTN